MESEAQQAGSSEDYILSSVFLAYPRRPLVEKDRNDLARKIEKRLCGHAVEVWLLARGHSVTGSANKARQVLGCLSKVASAPGVYDLPIAPRRGGGGGNKYTALALERENGVAA